MSVHVNFQSAAFLNLAFVFLGAFCGSLSCILCGKILRKKYFKFRLSLCFALLSAVIAFASLFVIKEQTQSAAAFLAYFKDSAFFAALYFFAGFLCSASLRIFFPIAALLYIAWTLSFGLYLYKKMPLPQKYSITASESFVRDDENGKEWRFSSDGEGALVDFAVYELDKNALLPLPHFWHAMTGARPALSLQGSAVDVLGAACQADLEDSHGAKKFFSRLFAASARKLLGSPKVCSVLIPKQQVYPAVFELKVDSSKSEFAAVLKKIM